MKQNFNPEIWLVERRQFNPAQWLSTPAKQNPTPARLKNTAANNNHGTPQTKQQQIEVLLERIENANVDITGKYKTWVSIGFALADEFNEMGRDYFHRLSFFHSGYKPDECNKQFDECLKGSSSPTTATVKTIFYLAMKAGVNVKI